MVVFSEAYTLVGNKVSECFPDVLMQLVLNFPAWLSSLSSSFTWPIVAFVGLLILKSPLSSFIGRLSAEYEPATGKIIITQRAPGNISGNFTVLDGVLSQPSGGAISIETLLSEHAYLNAKYQKLSPDLDRLFQESNVLVADKEKWLKAWAIERFIMWQMEIVYKEVYGSQIKFLLAVSNVPDGYSREYIEKSYYSLAKKEFTKFYDNVSFEQWLSYLFRLGLVRPDGDRVSITDDGKEFVNYLVRNGYYLDKVL
ncbi:hypothetical protein [Micavibrio aeruginosavorus]|uniref:hypothetical protein n=1 Tax=Micavibrio aeruginosavorus TaxID=349221 RepID=UPI003F4A8A7E